MSAKIWNNYIKKLSCVDRFSPFHLNKSENSLEHTGEVVLISLNIATLINRYRVESTPIIDIAMLLTNAAIHDIEESITGDIIRPVKYDNDLIRQEIRTIEDKAANKIFTESGMSELIPIWGSAKNGIEGKIISFADALTVLKKIHDEVILRGNKTLIDSVADPEFNTVFNKLADLMGVYDALDFFIEYQAYAREMIAEIDKER